MTKRLDYAIATRRQRFRLASWPAILGLAVGIFVGLAMLSLQGGRMIPGGPFISIRGDLIPSGLFLAIIVMAWPAMRCGTRWQRLCAALIILASAALMIATFEDVMSFWLTPFARGVLIAW